jgi:hypothetical protein
VLVGTAGQRLGVLVGTGGGGGQARTRTCQARTRTCDAATGTPFAISAHCAATAAADEQDEVGGFSELGLTSPAKIETVMEPPSPSPLTLPGEEEGQASSAPADASAAGAGQAGLNAGPVTFERLEILLDRLQQSARHSDDTVHFLRRRAEIEEVRGVSTVCGGCRCRGTMHVPARNVHARTASSKTPPRVECLLGGRGAWQPVRNM